MIALEIHWKTDDNHTKCRIRERFNIPSGMTVNHITRANVREEDIPLLKETERRGFLRIKFL